jgi:hypothetical protein
VYDVVQPTFDNVQDVGLNVPPALLSLNNTVPLGVVGELEVSVTDMVNVVVAPEFIVVEFGKIDVVVESSRVTVIGDVPLLVACVVSPEYLPVMVAVDCEFVLVYETVQLPADRVHVAGLKVPPAVSVNATVPDGVLDVFEVSATVTVNVTDPPEVTVEEFGVMDTLVGSRGFTARDDVAVLGP